MSNEELLLKYRETKEEKYIEELYLRCTKSKRIFMNQINSYYFEKEEEFDRCFLIAITKYDFSLSYKFLTYLIAIERNRLKNIRMIENRIMYHEIYYDAYSDEEKYDNKIIDINLISDNIDISKEVIDKDASQRFINFVFDTLHKYTQNKKRRPYLYDLILNRMIYKKSFKKISEEFNITEKAASFAYRKFIRFLHRSYSNGYKRKEYK